MGVDAPTDVLVGVGIGVTLSLLLFRRFTPNEVYPVVYRRGLEDQLGLVVQEFEARYLSGR